MIWLNSFWIKRWAKYKKYITISHRNFITYSGTCCSVHLKKQPLHRRNQFDHEFSNTHRPSMYGFPIDCSNFHNKHIFRQKDGSYTSRTLFALYHLRLEQSGSIHLPSKCQLRCLGDVLCCQSRLVFPQLASKGNHHKSFVHERDWIQTVDSINQANKYLDLSRS